MVMCIPAYMLAAPLTEQGMSPWQAVITVLLGNAIVLAPMLLIGHAGAKHGIPYAVLVRRTRLDAQALFTKGGEYSYQGGWNSVAVVALALGVLPNLPGFPHTAFPAAFAYVPEVFRTIYTYAWFIGLFIAAVVYAILMILRGLPRALAARV